MPLSLLGAMNTADLQFQLPQHAARAFPFSNAPGPEQVDLASCHFLCQCARLVYEDATVIQDVVTSRCAAQPPRGSNWPEWCILVAAPIKIQNFWDWDLDLPTIKISVQLLEFTQLEWLSCI